MTDNSVAQYDPLRTSLEQALGAQYDVLALLGRGGMGAVYLARERLLERLVAIKVLPSEDAAGEARERFLREARTAAQLSHPNIVPLLSFGEMGSTLFYIMRYVDGESLETRLKREVTLLPQDARRMLGELASALGEAHRLGIVHRDIKPDNVMIERETGRAMLTDFGIARQLATAATLTGTGMIVGSPHYMSPEQASGDRQVDGRSDLYSLGILGYRMLTGRLPFRGESVQELLMQQITAQPVSIAEQSPDVPPDIAETLMRCLAKDPSRRWADARALGTALAATSMEAALLPDALEGVPRFGTKWLLPVYLSDVGLVMLYAYTDDIAWLTLGLGVSLLPLVAISARVIAARRRGYSPKNILAMAFWPSVGSFLWWPRGLRPPDDVFHRLPADVRRGRVWVSVGAVIMGFVAVPLVLAGFLAGSAHFSLRGRLILSALGAVMAGSMPIGAAGILAKLWKRKWNLSTREADKLLDEPTHGSRFWERPAIAALLSGASPSDGERPTTSDALARAIRDIAAALPSTTGSLATEADAAAGELAIELRALEHRIAELVTQVDPAEQARLHARLEAMGPEREDHTDVHHQMRSLLRGQADLLGELDARRTALEARRAGLHDQLKMLWLQMVNYRAQVVAQSADAVELSGRIRELCRSIERRTDAVVDVERLLE